MSKQEGVFFTDITIEEVHILEHCLSQRPNAERHHREILQWLSEQVFELAAQGEVASRYHETTAHALHPEAA